MGIFDNLGDILGDVGDIASDILDGLDNNFMQDDFLDISSDSMEFLESDESHLLDNFGFDNINEKVANNVTGLGTLSALIKNTQKKKKLESLLPSLDIKLSKSKPKGYVALSSSPLAKSAVASYLVKVHKKFINSCEFNEFDENMKKSCLKLPKDLRKKIIYLLDGCFWIFVNEGGEYSEFIKLRFNIKTKNLCERAYKNAFKVAINERFRDIALIIEKYENDIREQRMINLGKQIFYSSYMLRKIR